MEKKHFDLKKINARALAFLCLATVLIQPVYGMKDELETNKIENKKLTQTLKSKEVEQLCLKPNVESQEELVDRKLLNGITYIGEDPKEQFESKALLACFQIWGQGEYFFEENCYYLITSFVETEKIEDPFLFFTLGYSLQEGKIIERSAPLALCRYQQASKLGSLLNDETIIFVRAQAKLGSKVAKFCVNNIGYNYIQNQNINIGLELLQEASDLGYPLATFNRGFCYHFGIGGKRDLQKAKQLYEKAAEGKIKEAQEGLKLLMNKALFYFEKGNELETKATEKNEKDLKSKSVDKLINKAVFFYLKSSKLRNVAAVKSINNLGVSYIKGLKVTQNFIKAVELYKLAHEFGLADAAHNLGICYEKGIGVDQDIVKAKQYYEEAEKAGNRNAKVALERLNQK